ncbi:UDP-N-acetylmuramoylalanyl-D-glutamate--2,6-diaminopimelate ligase (chromatophore) [Paulinella micropora]|uniref:UDP-N-acetylmuramoylalanyl-D-glutamate--2,6-diaminopimelate ligase n=1 Tax=Paulinella micropora TaxID=1928728 RepID=A0A1L5YCR6_9EUKA|nr:UDP-N-acetylmuramoylalanyl-D-glutamate--2,6- diaminopimelate ligase [Paulinella micropora]AQX45241.1 UDP-N-acetylmuramoylalanyl-D-glutamate--2,6- diaminopimelate ligase [Paulinella micropora]BBL86459.1 UDP-N-acetylmuramoylalanyl-D-glutamate--2,6-diaminopimelate ligase [Paulinella micropora]
MSQFLHTLLDSIGLDVTKLLPNDRIDSIACNSKIIVPGSVFIGLPGNHVHGSDFCTSSLSNGAAITLNKQISAGIDPSLEPHISLVLNQHVVQWSSIISSNFWQHPSRWLVLIGVTGTNGKTTVTHLIEHLSGASGYPSALFGTLIDRWPGYSAIAKNTTGFNDQVQLQLALAVEAGAMIGAMEVSSHALHQHRIIGSQFSGAVFTNLSQDHLDYHRSVEAYFEAKASLFEPPFLKNNSPSAVVNIDDMWGAKLAKRVRSHCWRSSLVNKEAELTIEDIVLSENGITGTLITPIGKGKLQSPMIGYFNLMNLLQSLGILLQHKGFSLPVLLEAVKTFRGVPGRMTDASIYFRQNRLTPQIVVDYAHTPDGLEKAILAIRPFVKQNLICIFGCGGDRDRSKRALMGKIGARLADKVIITSDNPRYEHPQQIIDDILSGVSLKKEVFVEADRAIAIMSSLAAASCNDLILILGKGHEDYQSIKGENIYFNDQEEVKKYIYRKFACDESSRNSASL